MIPESADINAIQSKLCENIKDYNPLYNQSQILTMLELLSKILKNSKESHSELFDMLFNLSRHSEP